MFIPGDRYSFSSFRRRPQRGPRGFSLVLIIVVVLIVVGGGLFLIVRGRLPVVFARASVNVTLSQLWNSRQYAAINARAEEILTSRPLDESALVYGGLAFFYQGVAAPTLEAKLPLFDNAIQYLRKALLIAKAPLTATIDYVLGKAYYQKGKYYLDLAIKYLNRSIEGGYNANDTYEYLGLAYSDLGEYDNGASYFGKALAQNPSDLLNYILAQTYYKAGNLAKSEEYLQRTISRAEDSKDSSLEVRGRFLLGRIDTDRKDYAKAEEQYQKILELDSNSADAHFFLGNLYERQDDKIKARAEWRAALRIDPSHNGARLKLFH